MTSHCRDCGSRICNHGACPECNPCRHCDGGDRHDKFFGDDADREMFGNDVSDYGLDDIGDK